MYKKWLKASSIRAINTFAEVMSGFVITGLALNEINWRYALSVSFTATIGCYLLALKGLPEVTED